MHVLHTTEMGKVQRRWQWFSTHQEHEEPDWSCVFTSKSLFSFYLKEIQSVLASPLPQYAHVPSLGALTDIHSTPPPRLGFICSLDHVLNCSFPSLLTNASPLLLLSPPPFDLGFGNVHCDYLGTVTDWTYRSLVLAPSPLPKPFTE